jgi:protein SCO1/2
MINKIITVLIALASLTAGLYFFNQSRTEISANSRVFEPARILKPFELFDQNDESLTNAFFNEKWTFLFLGFTQCPDVCPTTLAKLTNGYNKLKKAGFDDIQVLFVSVDPQRDTAERLKEYTAYFHQDFTAATGPHANLFPFVRGLGLMYSMTEDTTQEEYAVGHSGSIVLVNPQGQLHAMFKPQEVIGSIPYIDMISLQSDFQILVDQF